MWQSNSRMSLSFVESKGLLNQPGDNNCFLNSAVQVLWHLDVFRRSFRLLTGHMCMGNACIFCALKVIFTQFQYSDQSALPPDALRKALAKNFKDQQRFQLGLMDDAAECFENILIRIHGHITSGVPDDNCRDPHCISHQKFTQTLIEQVICPCGATSEPHVFNQMVHYVATNVLCAEKFKLCSGSVGALSPELFTRLLKSASTLGDTRNCPNNCGRQSHILKTLTNTPEVISVGLIWNSDRPSQTVIQQVIASIGTKLCVSQLYESVKVPVPQEEFHLVGVVCYYGKHYSTFFYHSKRATWISFDDANVKEMGSWPQVADKCTRGHYQPLLLLYASPVAVPVSTHTALQKTTMVTGHSFNNDSVLRQTSDHHRQGSGSSVERALHPGGQNPAPSKLTKLGSEWGTYHSDEEVDSTTKDGGGHFRQSSYLSAMEAVAKTEQARREHSADVSKQDSHQTLGTNLQNTTLLVPPHRNHENQNSLVDNNTGYIGSYSTNVVHCNKNYTADRTHNRLNGSSVEMQPNRDNVNNNIVVNSSGFSSTPYNQNSHSSATPAGLPQQNYPSHIQVASRVSNVNKGSLQYKQNNHMAYSIPPSQHVPEENAKGSALDWSTEEGGNTYIDRRAVEKVLGLQGTKQHHRSVQNTVRQTPGLSTGRQTPVPSTGRQIPAQSTVRPTPAQSTDRQLLAQSTGRQLPAQSTDRPTPAQSTGRQLPAQSTDRPTPAQSTGRQLPAQSTDRQLPAQSTVRQTSLHTDYQTAGDRNSSSSSSSSLLERLIRNSNLPPQPEQQSTATYSTVDKRFSSEESLSSASAGSIATVKANGKTYGPLSRSQESLTVIEDNTRPVRDLIQKMDQSVHNSAINVGSFQSSYHDSESGIFSRADGLMDMCAHKEHTGDFAAALVLCQQAIGNLQQVVNRSDVRENVRADARMKYRSCVERSRALHSKVQMYRQDSVTSTLSNVSDDRNISSGTEDRRHLDADALPSGLQSKTVEFPTPAPHSVVRSLATEDFPSYVPLSQRRKFMSDYVSKEDYFSHHPRPPQKATTNSCSQNKPSKPVVPPKPGTKPFLKHSISSENATHPGQARETGGEESINIYATLPRRPKNRERSSTLTGSEQSGVYRACVEKPCTQSPEAVNTSDNPAALLEHEHHKTKPTVSRKPQLTNEQMESQNVVNTQVQYGNRGVPNKQVSTVPSIPVQVNKRSVTNSQSQPENYSVPSKNNSGVAVKPLSNKYTAMTEYGEVKASQKTVSDKNQKNLVHHARQWSKEEIRDLLVKDYYQRTETGQQAGQSSVQNMVDEQMQQLTLNSRKSSHKVRDYQQEAGVHGTGPHNGQSSNSTQPTPHTSQYNREGTSIQRVPPQQCVARPENLSHNSHHPNVTVRLPRGEAQPLEPFSKLEAHQLALQHRPHTYSNHVDDRGRVEASQISSGRPEHELGLTVIQQEQRKPVDSVFEYRAVEKPAVPVEELPPPPPELLEPLHEHAGALHAHPSHFAHTPHPEPQSLDSYVVPGLRSIVDCSKISFAPHSTEHSHMERYRKDKDLADFCVVSKRECDPYDLSSSSGIERTDTQSDTSSVSTANSRTSSQHSKSALVKKRRHKPCKSVTFSDNVMLIARAQDNEEMPEEPNYIEYVQRLLKRSPIKSGEQASQAPTCKQEGKTGYDSDFDEDTTDSCTSDEVSATDKVQCNLCRKKLIEASFIYCTDCSAYMAKFQPS